MTGVCFCFFFAWKLHVKVKTEGIVLKKLYFFMKTWRVSKMNRGNTRRNGIVGKRGTQRGRTTTKLRGSLKDGGHSGETVWDRRSGGVEGHRMAWGPRPVVGLIRATCASSYVSSPLHGCRWYVGFPLPPVPSVLAQVGAYCPVLLSFLMMFNFFRLLSTSEVAILKVLCMFILHVSSSLQA